ncbi:hypothetical protein AVEN_148419-1 [Araneus ventricosus]|uniref:Peptidase aspartic putative domain-containing protein n=1 Tax=Araneus ventricosus TaxID=182803 RepID=A0A4Y2NX41_ARAVE|nr:hypothetical protein AVEN_148419-1 [Araneus ventricosus]
MSNKSGQKGQLRCGFSRASSKRESMHSSSTVSNELSKKGIILSDIANDDCEIGLLLGADVAGMLFLEGSVKLDSGLFLLKTCLGFVLTGKQGVSEKCNEKCDTVLNVISLFVKDSSINELWSLENIGIFYPIQKLNENNEHLKVIEEFENSMKILPDGRYQLCLPFKSDAIEFPSSKELTWKRHKKMCERAQRNGLLDDCKAVFKEWEELKRIEKIDCENETSLFLPHRPVVKTDSITTKIRPVFDASPRETGKNSLNDLLYKDNIVKPFLKWWGEVAKLSDIEIPRHLEINDTTQIHVCVDTCKEAHATCTFLRTDTSQGVKVVLVKAKSRVAPLKQATIPRLELMACCIGARLAHSVQQALNITEMETIFWSDSMVALYWLREKGGWSVFESNRIKEIKTLFPNGEWSHVPGKINPADLISRGCSPCHLVEPHWWEGPLWLVESPDNWPVTELINYATSDISSERKKVRLCNLNLSEEKCTVVC